MEFQERTPRILSASLAVSFALGFAPSAYAATAFVKSATNRVWNTSVATTFAGNVTAGNVIAMFVGSYPKGPLLNSVTATCVSGPFVVVDSSTTGTFSRAAMAYAVIDTTGPCTVTASAAAGTAFIDVVAHEISGVDTGSPVDNNQHRINAQLSPAQPGTGANAVTSGAITTTKTGDYVFAAAFNESLNGGVTITAGTGYTSRQQDLATVLKSEDGIQASAGTIAATFTTNHSTANFLTGIIAFQASGGVSDTISPTVSLSAPANNATVAGTAVTVSATASDNVGVAGVRFLLDGAALNAEDAVAPYSMTWNTTTTSSGPHVLSARARDAAGNTANAVNIAVTVDNQPPTGSVVINGGAAATNSLNATLTLSATDALSTVTDMRFSNTGTTYSAAEPYATTKAWTLTAGAGAKTVYAQFQNAAGNWSAALTDTIVYDITAPAISAVASNATHDSATIIWTTGEPATSQVEFGTTVSYGQFTTLDTNLVISHTVVLTGLAPQTSYDYRVRSADAAANLSIGSNFTFTTLVSPDTTPPTVPADLAATVLSPTQVGLSWTPSTDNVGVTRYRVFRNGIQIGSPTGTFFQDNAAARATSYGYAVAARDAAGNVSPLSTPVTATTPALIVSNVQSSSIGLTSAVMTWATDIPASGTVEYGITAAYGLTAAGNPTPATTHSVTLTGLNQNTTYHFRAVSADINNNRVSSGDLVFATLFGNQGGLFQNDILITGMVLPTGIKFLPNGDLLILELGGRVSRVPAGTTQIVTTPFLQLTNVGSIGKQGLMDLALDPGFPTNHFYYVFYTLGVPNHDRVSRFTATADLTAAVVGSEFVVYEDPQAAGTEHHGGALAFGADGELYISTGDHLDANASQVLTSPRGKILRINSDGTIPSDNPFNDGPGPNVDSIWALGLRDPSRGSFDPVTAKLYLGDAGGIDPTFSQEEINVGIRGANYGWPSCEGASCSDPTFTIPIHAYSHNGSNAAVIGGFVYRGSQFPAAYLGSYFFADSVQNWIRRLTLDASGNVTGVINFEPPDGALDGPYGDIAALAEGPDGALYYVDQGNTDGIGKIRRIRFVAADRPPIAVASADVMSGPAPLTVHFSSAGSYDPDGLTPTYLWNFGDGTTSAEANPFHTYTQNAAYQVRLFVSDGTNTTPAAPIAIVAGNPPVATILAPADSGVFRAGDVIDFSGSASDPEDGSLAAGAFTWTIDFLRAGQIDAGVPQPGVTSGTFQIPTTGRDFSGDARYRITLTVKDSTGLQSSAAVTIYPQKVNLTFDSVPSGLNLSLDGVPNVTPFVRDALIGFNHSVNAINQTQGSTTYTFKSWSDAGAQQHVIVVPAANQSYVATYDATSSSNTVITLDGSVHGQTDNGATSASTVVVGPIGTPTAGDAIVCEFVFDARSTFISVADNVNSGVYLPAVYLHAAVNMGPASRYAVYYKENVAAANTTITLTYSPANTRGAMSCQAWKGTPPAFALDSTFIQARDGTAANPTTGGNLIPFGDGRLVVGALGTRSVTAAAGAGYTPIDVNPTTRLFPEYLIQTTKTATAAGYTAAADTWYDQMAAFAPNTGGFCDSAVIMDWTGGTSGATVTLADLAASTKGGREQPGADAASGWSLWGPAAGMTYSTNGYQPFARTLGCPFYSGTGSGTLGIKYSTTERAHAALYNFDTSSPTVSAGVCFRTDLPNNDVGGPTDVFTIYANTGNGASDFSNVAVWGSGPTLTIYLETRLSDDPHAGFVPIVSGRNYWLDLRYVKGGNHSVNVYEGCGPSRTLVGTISHPAVPNGSVPSYLVVGSAGALTVTPGYNFYYSAIKLDYLYGRPLLP